MQKHQLTTSISALSTPGAKPFCAVIAWALLTQAAYAQTTNPDTGITEFVVTATKLGSDLDKAPVSVTSLDPDTLARDNIVTLEGVAIRTPSLNYSSPTNFAQAYIRGIGSNFLLSGLESSVATYIDGAYIQRQAGAVLDVVDVASIDVLKGPQGTLYGRNATGGAILMQTADPKDVIEGFLSAEYGNYEHSRAQGMINLPITDTLAVRIAGQSAKQDGFINNTGVPGGSDLGASRTDLIRAKVGWTPSDNFDAVYTFEYNNRASNAYGQHQRFTDTRCLACAFFGVVPSQGFYDATTGPNPTNTVEYYAQTLRLNAVIGEIEWTSISSYRDQEVGNYNEQDNTSAPLANAIVIEEGPTFTQDIYARSNYSGPLNFLAGVGYERDRGDLDTQLIGVAYGGEITGVNETSLDSYSAYGELYYTFGDGFKLTAGARYNVDEKNIDATNDAAAVAFFAGLGAPIPDSYSHDAEFKDWTPRLVLSYEQDRHFYYVSYNRGIKSGGFSTPSFPEPNTIDPEKLDMFEIGAKSSFFDDRVHTTAAIFYGKFEDIQVAHVGIAGVETQNAASADIEGFEFDLQWLPTDRLTIGFGGTYLHNRFDEYEGAAIVVETGTVPGLANGAADLSGEPLPRSPKWVGYLSANYSADIGGGWSANISPIIHHTSEYDFYAGRGGPLGLDYQEAFTKIDASIMIKDPSETLEFGIYGQNLTDEEYFVTAATTTFGAHYVPAEPLTYGVRVSKKF